MFALLYNYNIINTCIYMYAGGEEEEEEGGEENADVDQPKYNKLTMPGMCVWTHQYRPTLTHLHTHTHTHTCTHAYMHTHSHTYTHLHTCIHAYTLTHLHTCTHAHTYTHMHTCIYTLTHLHTHAHTCTRTHAYTLTHLHTHTHIHIHAYTEVVVSLDAGDDFLKQRVMNLPESEVAGTHNTEDGGGCAICECFYTVNDRMWTVASIFC